jgi:hypothetical protein
LGVYVGVVWFLTSTRGGLAVVGRLARRAWNVVCLGKNFLVHVACMFRDIMRQISARGKAISTKSTYTPI